MVSRGVNREVKNSITQRTVLSFISSFFDFIVPVASYTVGARLFLKKIWRICGQQWDDELPVDSKTKYLDWDSDLASLGQMSKMRSYFSAPVDWAELHMFGDSSEELFCAVDFFRARVKTSLETQVAFVFGKARVVPTKALSIPNLKLQAALLAIRLKEEVLKALTIPVSNTFMWTGSTTVLQWLNSGSKQPTFEANRIGDILESTTVDQLFHVLSGDNPAETGTRAISAESLKTSSWVNGPSLLKTGERPFKPSIDVLKKSAWLVPLETLSKV